MKIFGKGFNFSQDGPGNRLVYHLSGCNMKCIWCSNPEGMSGKAGEERSHLELIAESIRCKALFFSGGGVTFTGGEATLWHGELLETLKGLKEAGIHTALETNGTSKELPDLLPFIDYLIMDFKHYDSDALKKYTGLGNEIIKQNFENHCAIGRQQHIRIPLINGINTASPEKFAAYFSKFDTKNTLFEFLPYHEYGKEKWQEEYLVQDGFISEQTLQKFKGTFKKYNLNVIHT